MSVFNRERWDSESDRLWDRERGIGTQRARERETVRVTDYLGKFFNWDILARVNRGGSGQGGVSGHNHNFEYYNVKRLWIVLILVHII